MRKHINSFLVFCAASTVICCCPSFSQNNLQSSPWMQPGQYQAEEASQYNNIQQYQQPSQYNQVPQQYQQSNQQPNQFSQQSPPFDGGYSNESQPNQTYYGNASQNVLLEPGAYLQPDSNSNSFSQGYPNNQQSTVNYQSNDKPKQEKPPKQQVARDHSGLKETIGTLSRAIGTGASIAAPIAGAYMVSKAINKGNRHPYYNYPYYRYSYPYYGYPPVPYGYGLPLPRISF